MKRSYIFLFGCLLLGFMVALVACSDDDDADMPVGNLADGAVKVLVDEDGVYQITVEELTEAGLTIETIADPTLELSQDGSAVPYLIEGDSLIFYGEGPTSRYTNFRPYLVRTGQSGQLISTRANLTNAGPEVAEIVNSVHLESEAVYASNARTELNEETWFWQTIRPGTSVALTATLPFVGPGTATATFELYGVTYSDESAIDHDFDVIINGQNLGTVAWDGQTWQQATVEIPAGLLRNGQNDISLDNAVAGAVQVDIMHLNWVRLDINTTPAAIDDQVRFSGTEGVVPLTGFSGPPKVFDVSDAMNPALITEWDFVGGTARIGASSDMDVFAVGPNGYQKPAMITGYRESDWRNTANQVDLIIVSTDQVIPALAPLVTLREEQGLTVAVVPAGEIYDEFGFGEDSPESIYRFVKYAFESWTAPAPKYLFLVGDATYDFQGNLGPVPATTIPSLIVPVAFSGETVSDARLADVDGDIIPDLAVGRWPINSVAEVEELVDRTIAYEAGSASSQAIFTADGTEAQFATISDRFLTNSNLDDDNTQRLYGADENEVADVWNEGAWLVTYTGHGSLDKWGKDNVFSEEAVAQLDDADASPPIVLQFTCLTGFFAHPTVESISESLLHNDAGPVLLLGATSLTLSTHQEPLAVGLLNELQRNDNLRIGDALQIAKRNLDVSNSGIREVSDTFGLLGDPSALIVRPGT